MDVIVDLIELDGRLGGADAERRSGAHGLGTLACRNHGLRRHAAGVEVLAAQPALFNQHHRHAERGRRRCDRQSGGACTDDAEIGSELLSHRVLASKSYDTLTRQKVRHDVYTRAMEMTWGGRPSR
jgi:hypothetical protein